MAASTSLTLREKNAVLALAKAGVSTPTIAKAFRVPTQAIAAYKAHETIRVAATR